MKVVVLGGVIACALLLMLSVSSRSDASTGLTDYASHIVSQVLPTGKAPAEKLAYLTFLSDTVANVSDPNPMNDKYFVATRLLGYQLLHQEDTRTKRGIPFVVLVTEDISPQKQALLKEDGATVIKVEYLRAQDWVVGEMPEWRDVMTKLRAWELTEYSRILLLDGDMILNRCLDGVFDDPGSQFTPLNQEGMETADEGTLPEQYVLGTFAEANPFHAYPPTAENGDFKDPEYFNAGFFVFSPSKTMFDHYTTVMDIEGRWDPRWPEQNLLNYIHRREGKMPWQHIDTAWNIRFPSIKDKEGGAASLHDKWWHAHMDAKLQPFYTSIRWKMEGFYDARNQGYFA